MSSLNRSFGYSIKFAAIFTAIIASTQFLDAQESGKLKRVNEDSPREFYKDRELTVINFDKDLSREKTKSKQTLDDLYIAKGVSFKSERDESKVIVFRYNCGSISGDKCAGNSKPPYGGVMRITFHAPDDVKAKATVMKFGFFLSAVLEDGTSVSAYDLEGELIGTVLTNKDNRKSNSDFIGVESETPIHYLRIVPNKEIDPDFALDDIAFSKPEEWK